MLSLRIFGWSLVFFLFKNIESLPIRKFGNNSDYRKEFVDSDDSEEIKASSSDLITKAQSLINNLDFKGKEPPHLEDVSQIHDLLNNIENRIKDSLEATSNHVIEETARYAGERLDANDAADKIHDDAKVAHDDAVLEHETAIGHTQDKSEDLDTAIKSTEELKGTAETDFENNIIDLLSHSSDDYNDHCAQYELVQSLRDLLHSLAETEGENNDVHYAACQACLRDTALCTPDAFETESPTMSPTMSPTQAPTPGEACVNEVGPDGNFWKKIYQIQNGARSTTSFPLNTAAVGDINSAIGSSNAKLSDQEINSLAAPYDGFSNVYKMCSSDAPNCLFIKSHNVYQDNVRSFNVGTNCRLGLSTSLNNVPTWASPPGGTHGIDMLYSSPGLGAERCERYFLGHGALDCWAGPTNQRCINGGSSCHGYKKLDNATIYILTGTCA